MANEIRGISNAGTVYARIMNKAGLWWNGSTFETYAAGNWLTYDVAMTEQGNSSVYVADFPSAITSSGTYEYFVHKQAGGSPAETDLIINTGKIDWTGTSSVASSTGSMTGSDWLAYVLRAGFKRTDKDTEVYEATTDAIQEMRRRFRFSEAETEATTTDTISTLGDFKITTETDLGLVVGVVLEDGVTATPLVKMSKQVFDSVYPDINVTNDRGYPKDCAVYGDTIYIGPAPDQVSYSYRISYSRRAGTVSSATTGVPFTALYRDVLADKVLANLYKGLEEYDRANYYEGQFERKFEQAMTRESVNDGRHVFVSTPVNF